MGSGEEDGKRNIKKEKGHETHGGTVSGDELLIAIVKKKREEVVATSADLTAEAVMR